MWIRLRGYLTHILAQSVLPLGKAAPYPCNANFLGDGVLTLFFKKGNIIKQLLWLFYSMNLPRIAWADGQTIAPGGWRMQALSAALIKPAEPIRSIPINLKRAPLACEPMAARKTSSRKIRLIKKTKETSPVPAWVIAKTKRTVKTNPKRRNWRSTDVEVG